MDQETNHHIILLPFMAQGHLRPFLHLAHFLSSRTLYTVTLLTTPLNAANLRKNIYNTTTNSNLIISELPFNSTEHNLPPNVENTEKLPLPYIITLFNSSASLEPHLKDYLTRLHCPPLCIIFDIFLGWADNVAREFNSTGIAYSTCGAYGTAAYVSVWTHLPHRDIPDDEGFVMPGFPADRKFHRSQLHRFIRLADGTDEWSKFFQPQINMTMKCSGLLVNSVEEVEPLGFDVLRKYYQRPVWAVGPLVSSPLPTNTASDHACIKWLNTHAKDSVLYISFGSQNTLRPTQMMELAAGLELSGKPFLWVIRPPFGFDINAEFKPEWLPDEFEERMMVKNQGMLVHEWGPQLEILSNKSVGAFLSHCGWNSILEGLKEGLPIIGWPLAAEQAYNAKMLVEEMGVAVELARGLEGEVRRSDVKKVVEMVLVREDGSFGWEMKRKAVEVAEKLKGALKDEGEFKGSSVKGLDDFVDFVVSTKCASQRGV